MERKRPRYPRSFYREEVVNDSELTTKNTVQLLCGSSESSRRTPTESEINAGILYTDFNQVQLSLHASTNNTIQKSVETELSGSTPFSFDLDDSFLAPNLFRRSNKKENGHIPTNGTQKKLGKTTRKISQKSSALDSSLQLSIYSDKTITDSSANKNDKNELISKRAIVGKNKVKTSAKKRQNRPRLPSLDRFDQTTDLEFTDPSSVSEISTPMVVQPNKQNKRGNLETKENGNKAREQVFLNSLLKKTTVLESEELNKDIFLKTWLNYQSGDKSSEGNNNDLELSLLAEDDDDFLGAKGESDVLERLIFEPASVEPNDSNNTLRSSNEYNVCVRDEPISVQGSTNDKEIVTYEQDEFDDEEISELSNDISVAKTVISLHDDEVLDETLINDISVAKTIIISSDGNEVLNETSRDISVGKATIVFSDEDDVLSETSSDVYSLTKTITSIHDTLKSVHSDVSEEEFDGEPLDDKTITLPAEKTTIIVDQIPSPKVPEYIEQLPQDTVVNSMNRIYSHNGLSSQRQHHQFVENTDSHKKASQQTKRPSNTSFSSQETVIIGDLSKHDYQFVRTSDLHGEATLDEIIPSTSEEPPIRTDQIRSPKVAVEYIEQLPRETVSPKNSTYSQEALVSDLSFQRNYQCVRPSDLRKKTIKENITLTTNVDTDNYEKETVSCNGSSKTSNSIYSQETLVSDLSFQQNYESVRPSDLREKTTKENITLTTNVDTDSSENETVSCDGSSKMSYYSGEHIVTTAVIEHTETSKRRFRKKLGSRETSKSSTKRFFDQSNFDKIETVSEPQDNNNTPNLAAIESEEEVDSQSLSQVRAAVLNDDIKERNSAGEGLQSEYNSQELINILQEKDEIATIREENKKASPKIKKQKTKATKAKVQKAEIKKVAVPKKRTIIKNKYISSSDDSLKSNIEKTSSPPKLPDSEEELATNSDENRKVSPEIKEQENEDNGKKRKRKGTPPKVQKSFEKEPKSSKLGRNNIFSDDSSSEDDFIVRKADNSDYTRADYLFDKFIISNPHHSKQDKPKPFTFDKKKPMDIFHDPLPSPKFDEELSPDVFKLFTYQKNKVDGSFQGPKFSEYTFEELKEMFQSEPSKAPPKEPCNREKVLRPLPINIEKCNQNANSSRSQLFGDTSTNGKERKKRRLYNAKEYLNVVQSRDSSIKILSGNRTTTKEELAKKSLSKNATATSTKTTPKINIVSNIVIQPAANDKKKLKTYPRATIEAKMKEMLTKRLPKHFRRQQYDKMFTDLRIIGKILKLLVKCAQANVKSYPA